VERNDNFFFNLLGIVERRSANPLSSLVTTFLVLSLQFSSAVSLLSACSSPSLLLVDLISYIYK